jgi:hypothetical protein
MPDPNAIQAVKPYAVSLQVERFHVPYRGPLDSDRMNAFHEQVHSDLVALANQGNANAKGILNYAHTLQRETDGARLTSLALEKQLSFFHKVTALQGRRVGLWFDLHDGKDVSFLEDSDVSKRASVSTQYGEATVPMNAAESKTYRVAIVGSGNVSALQAVISATGDFDKGEGDGPLAYEADGTVEETPLANCVNGSNLEYWRRRVIFPLESDQSEVEVELTVQLPDQSSIKANVLSLHPYPLGTVDVTGLWIASDLSDSFALVPGFDAEDGIGKRRWFIPPQDVSQVKVRLRQRSWHEENGKKVFEYGLQELGIHLVEWDKTFDAEASQLADNHTFVRRILPVSGMVFAKLYGFHSDPVYTLEPANNRHLHFILARDPDGTDVVWNSDLTAAPQTLATAIDLGQVEELYLITTLNWVATASVGSPFLADCPPFLRGFGLDVTMVEGV